MIILGIDPGLRKTGFGVISLEKRNLVYKASGVILPNNEQSDSMRLKNLFTSMEEVLKTYSPSHSVIEKVFLNTNPKTTLALGQARGVAIAAMALHVESILELSSNEIKKTVVGNGHASKKQVQFMVQNLLKLEKQASNDASDALAAAIALSRKLNKIDL
ncbi:MAG: crossover junction endodeoxyribonuclease RuvC [Proteobacteria bacterium]|jgi:crossover junction endodeoxyribonuclease RuvC|nr:crossover junction endodeoxyribonuclease RuvC [Pseudomonadota bacterium]|tara:strand:+ start:254 stop:733 length:480 start_codon:yes stop_codon:yes gene_type:complete